MGKPKAAALPATDFCRRGQLRKATEGYGSLLQHPALSFPFSAFCFLLFFWTDPRLSAPFHGFPRLSASKKILAKVALTGVPANSPRISEGYGNLR